MKITTKLALAAIIGSLTTATSAFANGTVSETSNYEIRSYQFGNSQPAIVYVRKTPSVALNARGMSAGDTASHHAAAQACDTKVSIPGGIN
jgi:hypothetical protein